MKGKTQVINFLYFWLFSSDWGTKQWCKIVLQDIGPFFNYDFLIQNLLVVQKNVLIQKYGKNIEFC